MTQRSVLNKRIPTVFGLFLLALAVLTTSYLVQTGVILLGGAAPSDNPEDVRITNISSSSFTVAYKTQTKVIGTISLASGTTKDQIILDERDQQSGIPKPYIVHSIAVKNLKQGVQYVFSITSGSTTYQNNGSPFSTKTATDSVASPSATLPLTGKLLGANGTPPEEALIFVTTKGGQSFSALTKSNGVYIIPLNTMLTQDLSGPISLTSSTVMQLLATDGKLQSQAQVPLSGANPVPLITVGNNYNFFANTTSVGTSSASLSFPPYPQNDTLSATEVITTPKKDEGFSDPQPQFKGKALPRESVTIEIHSDDKITATVTADGNGNWTYRPTTPLSVGQHIISITSKDSSGILKTIQQSFTVFASGSQVTQSATPSGSLSPSPTIKVTPTTKPTVGPTVSITPTITVVPTVLTPTVRPTSGLPTPKPTLPPTGNNTLVVSSILGIVTALVGAVLFVLTKGAVL